MIVTERILKNADQLWLDIGSFQGIGAWHPLLAQVEGKGEEEGSVRIAIGKTGNRSVERLERIDSAKRFYRYKMLSSTIPVADYSAEFRVREGDDASTVIWSSDFRVPAGDEEATTTVPRAKSYWRARPRVAGIRAPRFSLPLKIARRSSSSSHRHFSPEAFCVRNRRS